jgi:hypothetical protein
MHLDAPDAIENSNSLQTFTMVVGPESNDDPKHKQPSALSGAFAPVVLR